MKDWVGTLSARVAAGQVAVLVSVAAAKGSVPRGPGTRMIVTAQHVDGTIGGGHVEYKAIEIARDLITARGPRALHRFPLGASLGQCCGGVVQLLFEPLDGVTEWLDAVKSLQAKRSDCVVVVPVRGDTASRVLIVTADSQAGTLCSPALDQGATALARSLLDGQRAPGLATLGDGTGVEVFIDIVRAPDFSIVLFGAGHVGRAVVRTLAAIDCRIRWVDARDDAFPVSIPDNVECTTTDTPEAEVAAAPAGAYFLVMTHSHSQDEALAECILNRGDFAYFGLIGSVSKRRQFEKRLEARGMSQARLATMTCPIGVAGVAGKEPEVIAIAVAAEMLQVRGTVRGQASDQPAAADTAANRRSA